MKTSCATSSRSVIPFIQRRTVAEVFIGAGFFAGVAAKAETASRQAVSAANVAHALVRAASALMPAPGPDRLSLTCQGVEKSLDTTRTSACATSSGHV